MEMETWSRSQSKRSVFLKYFNQFSINKLILFTAFCLVLLMTPMAYVAHAELVNNGNGLIYDTDLDITWYDAPAVARNWTDAVTWAANLSVTDVNGKNITGWRLPRTLDGAPVLGYDGTTTAGYNITSSEMGHLFYTALGNRGTFDVNGNNLGVQEWDNIKKGPFTNLQHTYEAWYSGNYWSGTDFSASPNNAWSFHFSEGRQGVIDKNSPYYALAVHDGNVGVPVTTGVIQLPKTGQTKCYNTTGSEIACEGTGQDGEIQAGVSWPNPRFTPGTGTEAACMIDNLTGLMWPRNGNLSNSPKDWFEAFDYVDSLNVSEGLCGYTDWRLPNIKQLETLLYDTGDPGGWLVKNGFLNVQSYKYWSSTTVASDSFRAWFFDLQMPEINYQNDNGKLELFFVWPVRLHKQGVVQIPKTGQVSSYKANDDGALQMGSPWPVPRFLDNNDGTVIDYLTGLIWTKDTKSPGPPVCGPGEDKNWSTMFEYVKCLNANKYLGFNDWRIPNRNELHSIIDFSKSGIVFTEYPEFSNLTSFPWWTSTTNIRLPHNAWFSNLAGWMHSLGGKTATHGYYVLPVRGGQVKSYVLTVSKLGTGSGTVTSEPLGINCGSACSIAFDTETTVTLTAVADPGFTFTGWSGACTGTAVTCTVTMDGAKSVTASFNDLTPPVGTIELNGYVSTGSLSSLMASSYIGGTLNEPTGIAVDSAGNIFVTGFVQTGDFPTTEGAYDRTWNSINNYADAYIIKFNSDYSQLLASTFIGGTWHDMPIGIAVDAQGNVFIAGSTQSENFPTTPGAYQNSTTNGTFIAKFNNQLSQLIASTVYDGMTVHALRLDSEGNVIIAGDNGDGHAARSKVVKFDNSLSQVLGSYTIGQGDGCCESIWAMTLDNENNVYVAGTALFSDFSTSENSYSRINKGYGDVFVAKLNSSLTQLTASTLLGGTKADRVYTIALDKAKNVYVAGATSSSDFPTTAGAFSSTFRGGNACNDFEPWTDFCSTAFISKFDNNLSQLYASTFIGGNGANLRDVAQSIIVDQAGNLYIGGHTKSPDFPTTAGAFDRTFKADGNGADAFVAHMSSDLTTLYESTLLSGTAPQSITDCGGCKYSNIKDMVFNPLGNLALAVRTTTSDFPTTPGVYRQVPGNHGDTVVTKFPKGFYALTNTTSVNLTLICTDAGGCAQMRFSNDGSNWSEAEPYSTTKAWTLTTGDGNKTVYAKFKDNAGNWSAPVSASITLDTTAPVTTPSVTAGMFNGAQSITLSANDGSTIYYTTDGSDPRTSETRKLYSGPIAVSSSLTLKYYAVDAAGNPEEVRTQVYTITYTLTAAKDGTGTGTVTSDPAGIACGGDCTEAYVSGTQVTLTALADPGFTFTGWSGACTGTAATCTVTMDGAKSVTASFNDLTPPTGTIVINGGAALTTNPAVNLTLTCTDVGGCTQMQFSNDGVNWSDPEPYAATKAWTLTSGDGVKTVFVRFCDRAGNWMSIALSVSIKLQKPSFPGDVNGDGKINLLDAVLAFQFAAGVMPAPGFVQEGSAPTMGDVDGDGKIGVSEGLYILQKVAGMR